MDGSPADLDSPVIPDKIAAAWAREATMEHASIASFARFTFELLAVGAPADLLLQAQEAARDEVEHAKACFTIASRFAGKNLGPGPLDISGAQASRDLTAIVAAAVKEGCVGETLSALLAEARSEATADPSIRGVLAKIAQDEGRHAELAWRFVGWAIKTGGDSIRQVAIDALEEALRSPPNFFDPNLRDLPAEVLRMNGLLDETKTREVTYRALIEMMAPIARQLREAQPATAPV